MEKIYVSACLLGQNVRYNAKPLTLQHPLLALWLAEGRLVSFCPEVSGGLPTPRAPAEITRLDSDTLQVKTIDGVEVTDEFERGAAQAVALCQQHKVSLAIMAEGSPSCGSSQIYDGTHSGRKIPGEGLTVAALRQAGVTVFSQYQLELAAEYLQAAER